MRYIQLDPQEAYIKLDPVEDYIKLDPVTTASEAFVRTATAPTVAAAAKAEDTLQAIGGDFTQGLGELLQYLDIIPEPTGGGVPRYSTKDPLQAQRQAVAQQHVKKAREAAAEHPVAGIFGGVTGYVAPWFMGGIPGLTANVMQAGAEQSTAVKAYGGTDEEALKSGAISSAMGAAGGVIPLRWGSPALQKAVPALGPRTATALTSGGVNATLAGGEALIQNELLKAYPELQTNPWAAAALGGVMGGAIGAIAGKGTRPLSKAEQDFETKPTPELLAKRIKEGNLRALRGIENDIHATKERSFHTEQLLKRIRSEIKSLSNAFLKAEDTPSRSHLQQALDSKKAREESLKTRLEEDNALIKHNEVAYKELAEKLSEPYVDPVTRAQNYKTEALEAGSFRAIRRALVSEFKAKTNPAPLEESILVQRLRNLPRTNSTGVPIKGKVSYSRGPYSPQHPKAVRQFDPARRRIEIRKANLEKGYNAYLKANYLSSDEVVTALDQKYAPGSKASDLTQADLAVAEGVIPLLQKAQAMDNPAVTYAVNVIYKARNRVVALRNKILGGEGESLKNRSLFTSFKFVAHKVSYQVLSGKSSAKDFFDVSEVFIKGENRLDYESNLHINGQHLTEHQKNLYRSIAKVYQDTWAVMNQFQESMGKKHFVPSKLGYIAPIRKGDYAVRIEGGVHYARGFSLDEGGLTRSMDTSDTSYVQRFFTLKEANDFINSFNALPETARNGQRASSVEKVPQIENLFQLDLIKGMREAAVEAGADSSVIQRMDTMIKEAMEKGGTIGSHHKKQMGFIEGGKGRELFASKKQQGDSFRESIVDHVKEVTRQIEKSEVQTKLDDLIHHQKMQTYPNTRDFISDMKNYHINTEPDNPLEAKGIKGLIDEYWTRLNHAIGRKGYHPQAHAVDTALGKATHAFYMSVLTTRPTFWVAQSAAFTVSFRSLVKDQGLLAANMDIAKGFNRFLQNDPELFNYFVWARDNTSSLHPEFINDLTKFGLFDKTPAWTQKMLGYLTGETPSAAMDSFSRAMTSAFFLEHFYKKGFNGTELYTKVAMATDENMVQYGKAFKAPVYARAGVIGDLISPLASFAHTQKVNFVNDLANFKRNPSYQAALPALVTFTTTLAMGGAIGTIGAAEIELLIHTVNYLLNKNDVDYRIPTLWEISLGSPTKALFGEENKAMDRALSHGVMSASTLAVSEEGFDIGSSNRWQPLFADIITGDKQWSSIVPVLNWAPDTGSALFKGIFNRGELTEGQRRDVARKLSPGWTFGFTDAIKFDSFGKGPQPHPTDDPVVEKTKERALARFLGTSTIDEHSVKLRFKLDKQETEKVNTKARSLMKQLALNPANMTPEQTNKIIDTLVNKMGLPPERVFSSVKEIIIKARTSKEAAGIGGKGGPKLPTQQQLETQRRYLGRPLFTGEE